MVLNDIMDGNAQAQVRKPDLSIDPSSAYSRKEFVTHAGDLFDLIKHSGKLREHSDDFTALNDLMRVLIKYVPGDNATNVERWKSNSHNALGEANDLETKASLSMAKFVEGKREALLDKLDDKQLYDLFGNVPIYEGATPENKKIKRLRDKIYAMSQASQQGQDPSAVVAEDVTELINGASDEKKEFIMRNQKAMTSSMTIAVIKALQKEYNGLFKRADGSVNRPKLKRFLIDNYQVAEDFISGVPDDEKEDYWNDNMKPQYLILAQALYGPEKKAQKLADNSPKELRKKAARALGLNA